MKRLSPIKVAMNMIGNRKKHVMGSHGAFILIGRNKDICAECHRPVSYSKIKHLFEMYISK